MMRFAAFFLGAVLTAAGVFLGLVYPKLAESWTGREIGQWNVYTGGEGFSVPETTLSQSDGPTLITVALRSTGPLGAAPEREILTLEVLDAGDAVVFATSLGFPEAGALESPQTGVARYETHAGRLDAASGPHRFVLAPGAAFTDRIGSVDLTLRAVTYPVQPAARPVGFGLIGFGAIILWFSMRTPRRNMNSQPPPKWGRR